MTAINPATDIPSNCNTLERLFAWQALLLKRLNPGAKIIVAPDDTNPRPVVDVALIKSDTGGYRLAIQAYIPIADSYPESKAKFWENALEIDTVAIPAAFKAN